MVFVIPFMQSSVSLIFFGLFVCSEMFWFQFDLFFPNFGEVSFPPLFETPQNPPVGLLSTQIEGGGSPLRGGGGGGAWTTTHRPPLPTEAGSGTLRVES